jgi:hypothetical protein
MTFFHSWTTFHPSPQTPESINSRSDTISINWEGWGGVRGAAFRGEGSHHVTTNFVSQSVRGTVPSPAVGDDIRRLTVSMIRKATKLIGLRLIFRNGRFLGKMESSPFSYLPHYWEQKIWETAVFNPAASPVRRWRRPFGRSYS